MTPAPIFTQRLLLRPFRPEDLERVYYGLSHPEVIRCYGVSYGSLEATRAQMAWYEQLEKEQSGRWWAVCDPEDHIFYGATGINNWLPQHRRAEIGFWLLPEYWGKGIMTEAAEAMIQHAFQELQIHRIEGIVETENPASQQLMERLGFKLEGTLEDYEIKEGKYLSLHMYARLNKP